MREKTVKRFYCDHCAKGGFKKPDMARHESSCTLNPKRVCYLCGGSVDIAGIIEAMKNRKDVRCQSEGDGSWNQSEPKSFETKSEEARDWLMEQTDGCPACALSVLRQGKIFAFEVFDYKEELSGWYSAYRGQDYANEF